MCLVDTRVQIGNLLILIIMILSHFYSQLIKNKSISIKFLVMVSIVINHIYALMEEDMTFIQEIIVLHMKTIIVTQVHLTHQRISLESQIYQEIQRLTNLEFKILKYILLNLPEFYIIYRGFEALHINLYLNLIFKINIGIIQQGFWGFGD